MNNLLEHIAQPQFITNMDGSFAFCESEPTTELGIAIFNIAEATSKQAIMIEKVTNALASFIDNIGDNKLTN